MRDLLGCSVGVAVYLALALIASWLFIQTIFAFH